MSLSQVEWALVLVFRPEGVAQMRHSVWSVLEATANPVDDAMRSVRARWPPPLRGKPEERFAMGAEGGRGNTIQAFATPDPSGNRPR